MERCATMIKAKPKKPKAIAPTLTKLAAEMGVSISTVWRWQNDGIPGKGGMRARRAEHLRAAIKKLGEPGAAA